MRMMGVCGVWAIRAAGTWPTEGGGRTLIELNVELIEEKPEPASNEAMTSTTTTKDRTWLAQHTHEYANRDWTKLAGNRMDSGDVEVDEVGRG